MSPKTIDAVSDLLPDLKAYWPEMARVVAPLTQELRMISERGLDTGRSTLSLDADNLASGVQKALDMRQIGFTNADTADAETALTALALDMRARTMNIFKDKAAGLRIHAEVSANRVDPDAAPLDLTDGYRLLTAVPVSLEVDDGMIVQDIGLPERGGQAGRVEGSVLVGIFRDISRYEGGAGPIETVYLPAGRRVALRAGEQVRVHTQGHRMGDAPLKLSEYNDAPYSVEIEAQTDDVWLYGPMTFEASPVEPLTFLRETADLLRQSKRGKMMRILTNEDSIANVFLFGTLVGSIVFFIAGMMIGMAAGLSPRAAFSPGIGCLLFSGLFGITALGMRRWGGRKLRKTLGAARMDRIKKLSETFSLRSDIKNCEESESLISALDRRVTETQALRAFAIRKLVVKEREGIRTVQPLPALPAPSFEMETGTVIDMRVRA